MADVVNRRRSKRHSLRWEGMIYAEDGRRLAECSLRNVSASGAQVELRRELSLPLYFLLCLTSAGGVRRRCQLVWQFSVVAGLRFLRADE